MRRRYYVAISLLLLLSAGLWSWKPWEPVATLRVSEIHQRDGKHWATVVLENHSSRSIFYEGVEGAPQCHFSERTHEGLITDAAPSVIGTDWSKAPELRTGERVVFEVQLKLGSRNRPIADPFKVGVKLRNSPSPPAQNPARKIPVVGRWLPSGEHLLWSAESRLSAGVAHD